MHTLAFYTQLRSFIWSIRV